MEAALEQLVSAVNDLQTTRYCALVATVLSIYDWLIIFQEERHLLGHTRISLGKALYYVTRIITISGLIWTSYVFLEFRDDLSSHYCVLFLFIDSNYLMLSVALSYWMLSLRLFALYRRKKVVVWLLYIGLVVSYSLSFVLANLSLSILSPHIVYNPDFKSCVVMQGTHLAQASFEATLGFEFTLFVLTMYRAWVDYRSQMGATTVPLLQVMYRDGTLYFIVMFGTRLWNIIIFATKPSTQMFTSLFLMLALINTLSCRIYLNVVSTARQPQYLSDGAISENFAASANWNPGWGVPTANSYSMGTNLTDSKNMTSTGDHTFHLDMRNPPRSSEA